MKYVRLFTTEADYNLAAEEYLLMNTVEDIFMLWVNHNAVIVGRNQNTLAEINLDYVRENNISVVRRLTGGGAVYHDSENLNFTFIKNSDSQKIDFAQFTSPIIEALAGLGVNAVLSGRNDLTIDTKKFSGNAQTIVGKRVLHHGTLMLGTNKDVLSNALKVDSAKIVSKGVKSVASRVTTINSHLEKPITITQLIDFIRSRVDAQDYPLAESDFEKIETLRREKYSTWDWNFGQSPKFSYNKSARFDFGGVSVSLNINGGIIKEIKISGDFFGEKDICELENHFVGVKHEENALYNAISEISINDYIMNAKNDDILSLFF